MFYPLPAPKIIIADPPNMRLMKALKFSEKELHINRTGQLSNTQKRGFEREYIALMAFLWVVGAGGLIFFAVNLTVINAVLVCVPVVLAFILSVIGLMMASEHNLTYVQHRGVAKMIFGRVTRHSYFDYMNRNLRWRYYITIQTESFEVTRTVYEAFIQGECYVLFYEPHLRVLLSAEHRPIRGRPRTMLQNHRSHRRQIYVYR